MVAPRKIRCVVVVASADNLRMPHDDASTATHPRFRPSDLLPWADPHIRSLVEQLQREVREEMGRERVEVADTLPTDARWTAFDASELERSLSA